MLPLVNTERNSSYEPTQTPASNFGGSRHRHWRRRLAIWAGMNYLTNWLTGWVVLKTTWKLVSDAAAGRIGYASLFCFYAASPAAEAAIAVTVPVEKQRQSEQEPLENVAAVRPRDSEESYETPIVPVDISRKARERFQWLGKAQLSQTPLAFGSHRRPDSRITDDSFWRSKIIHWRMPVPNGLTALSAMKKLSTSVIMCSQREGR